jgi:tetratricopeptide (TPR) repeat protein
MVRHNWGRHCWLIVLALLAFALPAVAQDGALQGTVKDVKGAPVEGAKITIELVNSGRPKELKSGKNGDWLQIGLVGGQYTLTVEKEGIGTSKRVVTVRARARNNYDTVLGGSGRADSDDPKVAAMGKAFDEGVAASVAGKHDEAIAKFEAAIAIIPACADCYYNIGLSYSEKKDFDKAEAAYKKAIEINPKLSEAYSSLAKDYNTQRKFDLAAAASAKATELNAAQTATTGATSPDTLYNQGVILWNAGKIADAKKQFEATIAAKPDHADAHYQLAMALVNEGNLKGASAEFDTYLKLAPTGQFAAQAKALAAQLPK